MIGRPLALMLLVVLVVGGLAAWHPFSPSAAPVTAGASGDAARGATLFAASCAACHGADGGGGVGPDIAGVSAEAALAKIAAGGGAMPAGLVTGPEALDVAAFVDALDAAPVAATTAEPPPATTAEPPPATTVPAPTGPSEVSVKALADLGGLLRRGQSQVDVLVEHTGFLELALREDNVFNVRFHAEHLSNIVHGEPVRDLDTNGEASNPGDGVGLAGSEGGYVADAEPLFAEIAADPGVSTADRERADRSAATVRFAVDRLATLVERAERIAAVAAAADAADQIRLAGEAVADVVTAYEGMRASLRTYGLAA